MSATLAVIEPKQHLPYTPAEMRARSILSRMDSLSAKIKSLEDDIRALWLDFDNLKAGETVLGCATKKEFCEKRLHRTPRAIRYMLAGGNPYNDKQVEIISPLQAPMPAEGVQNYIDHVGRLRESNCKAAFDALSVQDKQDWHDIEKALAIPRTGRGEKTGDLRFVGGLTRDRSNSELVRAAVKRGETQFNGKPIYCPTTEPYIQRWSRAMVMDVLRSQESYNDPIACYEDFVEHTDKFRNGEIEPIEPPSPEPEPQPSPAPEPAQNPKSEPEPTPEPKPEKSPTVQLRERFAAHYKAFKLCPSENNKYELTLFDLPPSLVDAIGELLGSRP